MKMRNLVTLWLCMNLFPILPHGLFPGYRKPLHRSGHVTLDLCTSDGLKRETISKKNKALYKEATKVKWGDDFEGI